MCLILSTFTVHGFEQGAYNAVKTAMYRDRHAFHHMMAGYRLIHAIITYILTKLRSIAAHGEIQSLQSFVMK